MDGMWYFLNIYQILNEITAYIDQHIEEKINYNDLSRIMGVSSYTMQRVFSVIVGVPLSEYIRKRKLSCAAFDLMNSSLKVIDVAIKYGYENATSFSRAFTSFHKVRPSGVTKNTRLKQFPRVIFDEDIKIKNDIEYSVVELPKLILYGKGIRTNNSEIAKDAPLFFAHILKKYKDKYGFPSYGMIAYQDETREECSHYYCLYEQKIDEFECVIIPKSKWLKFTIFSYEAKDIQETSHQFYEEFLPSCKYSLREIPELEYYHNGITDFFIPIF